MERLLPILCATVAGMGSAAAAPGHTAQSNRIALDPDEARVYLHTTGGLLVSEDSGQTFSWVCSDAAGGHPAPKLAVRDGRLLTVTLGGIGISDDGARTFEAATVWPRPTRRDPGYVVPLTDLFYSSLEVGSDGRVWISSATGGARDDVFVSEDGREFVPVSGALDDAWWRSLKIAESDPDIVVLSGAIPPAEPGEIETPLLYRTADGGGSWLPLALGDLDLSEGRNVVVEGLSPADPNIIFVRARSFVVDDILYRSTDGGASWEEVFRAPRLETFAMTDGGRRVLAGGPTPCDGTDEASDAGCAALSTAGGGPGSFEIIESSPRMACGTAATDGSFYVCADEVSDRSSLSHSPRGTSWTALHRFSEILGPLPAPSGSIQARCAEDWDLVCTMFGACTTQGDADAGPAEEAAEPMPSGGCLGCSSSRQGLPSLATALAFAALLLRPRRRR